MSRQLEVRYALDSEFEARSEANKFVIAGYAAVFNSRTQLQARLFEQIQPGAFTKTIQEADVRALFNHDPMYLLGRSKANTLRMSQDTKGLHYEVDLPNTQVARDLYESIERGDISQSSFAFYPIKAPTQWEKEGNERFLVRTLQEVRLKDVSPVTFPAYEDATIGVRAAENIAEMRGLDLELAKSDLIAAFDELDKPVAETTYVAKRQVDSRIIAMRARYNQ